MTSILVTSANGANGFGYGAVLAFSADGSLIGPFSQDRRITDPRGLGREPSGELVYVNSGDDRVLALDRRGEVASTQDESGTLTQEERRSGRMAGITSVCDGDGRSVPSRPVSTAEEKLFFPMGSSPFLEVSALEPDGDLYLASGVGPSGEGENTVAVFDRRGALRTPRLVDDPELSPLDLVLAPNGNIVVSSEWPFGATDATCSVREYDHSTGALARVLATDPALRFARPRGLRFGSDGRLYCVGQDHVVAFDFLNRKLPWSRRATPETQWQGPRTMGLGHLNLNGSAAEAQ